MQLGKTSMSTYAVFFLLSVVTAEVQPTCLILAKCPCGKSEKYVTICLDDPYPDNPCSRLLWCKSCRDGLRECLDCHEGFQGPLCSKASYPKINSRQKRQSSTSRGGSEREREVPVDDTFCDFPGGIDGGGGVVTETDPATGRSRTFTFTNDGREEEEYSPGTWIQYFCNPRYVLVGTSSLLCEEGGFWSADKPTCRKVVPNRQAGCEDPGFIPYGRRWLLSDGSLSTTARTFQNGESVAYGCVADDFYLTGSAVLTCSGGEWSTGQPRCRSSEGMSADTATSEAPRTVTCQDPGQVPYADRLDSYGRPSLSVQRFNAGESVAYNCRRGFALRRSSIITCQASGTWSNRLPYCIPINSRNSASRTTTTTTAPSNQERKYCQNPGPLLYGTFTAVLPDSSLGSLFSEGDEPDYPEGTRLLYYCDEDYALIGFTELTCLSTGSWSSAPPICSSDCGRIFVEDHAGKAIHRVIHGTKTEPGEWPWAVAIGIQRGNVSEIECGGALINSQTVITAAHCLVADRFTLYFGKVYRSVRKDDTEVMVRASTRVIRHRDYNSTNLDSDIGLITFAPRIRYSDRVQPICLPSRESTARNLQTGKQGYVTGWGLTENQLLAEELRMAQLPVLTNRECKEAYSRLNSNLPITRNMFCAGFEDAKQSVCSGDSGSPLVFYNSMSDRYTLEGLVSFGVQGQCGLPGRYTLFTKVVQFVPWILRNLS